MAGVTWWNFYFRLFPARSARPRSSCSSAICWGSLEREFPLARCFLHPQLCPHCFPTVIELVEGPINVPHELPGCRFINVFHYRAIYRAHSRRQAQAAFCAFRRRWQSVYGSVVRQLERDLPQLLSFFSFPRHLWKKLRTTNIIERCFVEVRRRTGPMVYFVNVTSADRLIYSIFQRFNLEWKTCTLRFFTQAA